MNNLPLVTIYMPVYNGEKYIAETLDSILRQTYTNYELLIVNDGSTDNTEEIARQYAGKDSRIRIINHETNKGLSAARNTGWQSADERSKYLMNHDSDDISEPKKLETLVNYLEQNKQLSALGCFCRYIDEAGMDIGFPRLEWKPKRIRKTFAFFNSIVVSATLVRKELQDTLGNFRSEYGGCDDYDFWSRGLINGNELANIPQFLHKIRIHRKSFSTVHSQDMNKQAKAIRDNYLMHFPGSDCSLLSERFLHKILRQRMLMGTLFG